MTKNIITNYHNTQPDFSTMPPDATHWAPWNEELDFLSGWYRETNEKIDGDDDVWQFKFGTYDPDWNGSSRNDGYVKPIYAYVSTREFYELKAGDIIQNINPTARPALTLFRVLEIEGERMRVAPFAEPEFRTNMGRKWYADNYRFIYRPESESQATDSENDWVNV